jgi:hypothetical protein
MTHVTSAAGRQDILSVGGQTSAITTHPLTYGPLESLRNFQGSATQHEEQKQHRAHEGSEVCVEIK